MHFCIDRYEYPNRAGATPVVATTWDEAAAQCKSEGKRLCKDTEWTLACEGDDRTPYPYGNVRDATACNFDKPYIMPDNNAYANPPPARRDSPRRQREFLRLARALREPVRRARHDRQRRRMGRQHQGHDDEAPYISGLKAATGAGRNRCRPMT